MTKKRASKPTRYVKCLIDMCFYKEMQRCVAIDSVFCAREVSSAMSPRGYKWSLTHRRTGYSAGRFAKLTQARRAAVKLQQRYPTRDWRFTDPMVVKGWSDARAIVLQCGGR